MTVLQKAVLINYDKLKNMIESNTVDADTTYFLSGKEIINAIKDIEVPSIEGLAKTTDVDEKLKGYIKIDKITSTDTSKAPDFVGQIAIESGVFYIAETATGPEGWRILEVQHGDHL